MPISIYDLEQERKTVTLDFGQDSLTLTYRPQALTPAKELAIMRQARSESDDDADDFEELERAEYNITRQLNTFTELVESWDFQGPLAVKHDGDTRLDLPRGVTDLAELESFAAEHGGKLLVSPDNVVPIQPAYLKLLGSHFLMMVIDRINQDMRPNPKRRKS
jgi:hypothetical protein